jgi:hypothetical protein
MWCLVKQADNFTFTLVYSLGTGTIYSGVKQPGHETEHTPPSSAEIKNAWYTSASLHVFMAWYLIKHWMFLWCGS